MSKLLSLLLATTFSSFAFAQELIVVDKQTGIAGVTKQEQVKKRRTTALPGVGGVNKRLTRSSVIRTNGDGTDNVLISSRFPNRIATPFANPRVIGKTNAQVVRDGSSLFISPPKKDEPFTIFVTGSNAGDAVISLTLIPKDIPSQVVALQIDSTQGGTSKAPRVEGYTQQVVDLLRTVAAGKTPAGYAEGIMPNFVGRSKNERLVILPVTRYSGSNLDIYKYKVENSHKSIELSETSFYQKGVRAVSIFPNIVLNKGESTFVYVLADKTLLDGESDGQ